MPKLTLERTRWWNKRYRLMANRLRELRKDIDRLSQESDTNAFADMDVCFCGGALAGVLALLEQARKSQVGK